MTDAELEEWLIGKWVVNTGQLTKKLHEQASRAVGDLQLRSPSSEEWAWAYFIEELGLWGYEMSPAMAKALWPGVSEWFK